MSSWNIGNAVVFGRYDTYGKFGWLWLIALRDDKAVVDAVALSAEEVRSRREEWVGRASIEWTEEKEALRGRGEIVEDIDVSVGLIESESDVAICVSVVCGVRYGAATPYAVEYDGVLMSRGGRVPVPCIEPGRAERFEYLEPIVLAGDEGSVRGNGVIMSSGEMEYGCSILEV